MSTQLSTNVGDRALPLLSALVSILHSLCATSPACYGLWLSMVLSLLTQSMSRLWAVVWYCSLHTEVGYEHPMIYGSVLLSA